MFDPTNPSKQVALVSVEPQVYPGNGHSDSIDVTGFRQLLVAVNVPGGVFPIPPAGSTIEVDGLGPDGLWGYQIQPPIGIAAVGFNLIRTFGVLTDHVRLSWTMPAAGAFGYWVVGQS